MLFDLRLPVVRNRLFQDPPRTIWPEIICIYRLIEANIGALMGYHLL